LFGLLKTKRRSFFKVGLTEVPFGGYNFVFKSPNKGLFRVVGFFAQKFIISIMG